MSLPVTPPSAQGILQVTCWNPDGSFKQPLQVEASGGPAYTLRAVLNVDAGRRGFLGYCALWCGGMGNFVLIAKEPAPSVEVCLVLSLGDAAEPEAYGTWKAPDYGYVGRLFQVQGVAYEQLAIYTRLPDALPTQSVMLQMNVAGAKFRGGRYEVTYGRFMVPGK